VLLVVQQAYVHGILGMQLAYVRALHMQQGTYAIQKNVFFLEELHQKGLADV
jgi:hypothetical protein